MRRCGWGVLLLYVSSGLGSGFAVAPTVLADGRTMTGLSIPRMISPRAELPGSALAMQLALLVHGRRLLQTRQPAVSPTRAPTAAPTRAPTTAAPTLGPTAAPAGYSCSTEALSNCTAAFNVSECDGGTKKLSVFEECLVSSSCLDDSATAAGLLLELDEAWAHCGGRGNAMPTRACACVLHTLQS